MKYKAWQQDTIEQLAAVDPDWELWNVLRFHVLKREQGYPIRAKAWHGPFIEKENGKVIGLQLAYNYVGLINGWWNFIVHEDNYHKLRSGIMEHDIVIESTQITEAAICPWWKHVTFNIRRIPSDRFITCKGQVIYYDDIAEQLELDLWSDKR